MNDTYNVLIVIPCLNEQNHIEPLIHGLIASNKDLPVQIIIADGGSSDNTVNLSKELDNKYPNVTYLHNPKRIQSAAINLAVEKFGDNKEYLIRIDAHAGYPDDYCASLLREAEKTGAQSVVVPMDTVGITPRQKAIAAAQNSKMGNGGSSHRTAGKQGHYTDHGHHALMRIDAFKEIGGYDENFSHNEDAELDKRLTDAGKKIWLTGSTYCTYYPRDNFIGLFNQYINYGQGRIKTILKHKMKPKPRQVAPAAILPACLLTLIAPLIPVAILPFWAWVFLCLGYGAYIGIRAKNNDIALQSGIAAMAMHLGWSIGFWYGLVLHMVNNK